MDNVPIMRTLPEAFAELKKADPNTSYTLRALRSAVKKGEIPSIKVGNKNLINLHNLYKSLNMPSEMIKTANEGVNKIRSL